MRWGDNRLGILSGASEPVVDELAELEELSAYYESLMTADDKIEAALIQRDV